MANSNSGFINFSPVGNGLSSQTDCAESDCAEAIDIPRGPYQYAICTQVPGGDAHGKRKSWQGS
jgi:hypothetical protein